MKVRLSRFFTEMCWNSIKSCCEKCSVIKYEINTNTDTQPPANFKLIHETGNNLTGY